MDKKKVKSIRGLILFSAVVVMCILYSQEVIRLISLLVVFIKPFIIGGAIAFVINILMKRIESLLFAKAKGRLALKMKRPVSIVLSIVVLVLAVFLLLVTITPQIARTTVELGTRIPVAFESAKIWAEEQMNQYPQLSDQFKQLENLEFDWKSIYETVFDFMQNGLSSVITSTFSVASSIVGGAVSVVVAFIFAIYILAQKERLGNQCDRVLAAYCSEKAYRRTRKVAGLLHKNFSSFISGQCLEAIILGTMFVIVMTIFGFPYAVLIGVLIAFTALIPIVGAFIGCAVGVFLIMIDDPIKALWFLVLFLVLQQIEGNLIYPHVVGNSVGLPSIWVLVAVSLGGSMMGVLGMLLFIPLVSTGYTLVKENVNRRNSERPLKPEGDGENRKNVKTGIETPKPIKEAPKAASGSGGSKKRGRT